METRLEEQKKEVEEMIPSAEIEDLEVRYNETGN